MNKTINYLNKTSFMKNFMKDFEKNDDIQITNINQNISLLLILSLYRKTTKNILIVTPNLYQSQKVFDKLSNLMDDFELLFFPQDEFITTEMLAMSEEFKLERINTVKNILENNQSIVVTHPTGLLKPLIPKKEWETAILKYKTGDIVNIKQLVETLISYGYKRDNTVEKQGDFNVKGSILDIYPLNEEKAIRVDFFDDEIDSIRYFDVSTQRSTKKINDFTIYPLYEFFYSKDTFNSISDKIRTFISNTEISEETKERFNQDIYNLENHNEIDKLSRYISLAHNKTETILDYMNNELVVYLDFDKVNDNYNEILRDITDWYESTNDYPKIGFELIKDINYIYSGKSLYLDVFEKNKKNSKRKNIVVRAKDSTLYNGNFHMIINDLVKFNGHTTVVLSFTSKKALQAFVNIIEDKVKFLIIGEQDEIVEKRVNLLISNKSISTEFFDINTVFLNESNILKTKTIKKNKYKSSFKDTQKLTSTEELKKGNLIVHYQHGIGRFIGVETMTLGTNTNDYIHISYRGDDSLYIPVENINLIQRFNGSEGTKPKLNKLGGGEWAKTKQRVRSKVKDIADKLIKLYALREQARGFSFSEDSGLQLDFEADFPYEETEDQLRAINEVKKDMESHLPMDRLLCGDVGYGKTEVAIRAAFKAVLDNKQVAYLAPTTVLSRQHYYTFKDRLDKHGIKVELLNRFVTPANQRKVLHNLRAGITDIVIGTHRILSKDIKYADLGLLIIDEEQRFGVEHKERIKEFKINVDVLSLSATPIPRTLQMAIMGVKSMSLLETPPKNRYPIQTYVLERHDSIIRDAIQRELARHGQIFYLYNKVEDINVVADKIKRLVPDARVTFAHGKMRRVELEDTIEAFLDKEYDVLVSTTIIETGIDIPNANTLLIHDADRLGLSQLYQIRGRVGRSDKIAYAYLMYNKQKQLNEEARKRLQVIKEFTQLGSGFKIAMRDLSIRGAGDVLGTEQSGFIDSVGIDLYLEMLKEEIAKQTGDYVEKDVSVSKIKIGVNKYIDSNYVNNDFVKVEMHRKIANIKSKTDINNLIDEFTDRFGTPSEEIVLYMYEKLFEHLAKKLDIEKIRETKNNVTFVFSEKSSKNMNGEYLFTKANEISKFIRFSYRLNQINIIVDTIKLNRHYLYIIVDLLETI